MPTRTSGLRLFAFWLLLAPGLLLAQAGGGGGGINGGGGGSGGGGVTSLAAGTGISVSAATGAVTVTNTAPGASPAGSTGDLQTNGGGGMFGAITPGTGVATFLATPTANLLPAWVTSSFVGCNSTTALFGDGFCKLIVSPPASAALLGSNSSSAPIAATAHGASSVYVCIAASGSGSAYTCSTTPTFTPATGDLIYFYSDVANTGAVTIAINGGSPLSTRKYGPSNPLVVSDLLIGQWTLFIFNGTNLQMVSPPSEYSDTLFLGNSIGFQAYQTSGNANIWQFMRPDQKAIAMMSDHQVVWRSVNTGNFFSGGSTDTGLQRDAAKTIAPTNGTQGTTAANYGAFKASAYYDAGTTFTTNAGCGTTTALTGGSTAGRFALGANGPCTVIITMGNTATAANGWACYGSDRSVLTALVDQSADSTTTASLNIPTGSLSGDVISFGCLGY